MTSNSSNNNNNIKYSHEGHVESVNGFRIVADKHAYQCQVCGAIFQSKNARIRSVWDTDDPRCKDCTHGFGNENLVRICDCPPVVREWIRKI